MASVEGEALQFVLSTRVDNVEAKPACKSGFVVNTTSIARVTLRKVGYQNLERRISAMISSSILFTCSF